MSPHTPRIRALLAELAAAERDLAEATSAALAACARSDIHAIRHSLFLAGWQAEAA